MAVWRLAVIMPQQLATDDSFVFSKSAKNVRELIEGLPEVGDEENSSLAHILVRSSAAGVHHSQNLCVHMCTSELQRGYLLWAAVYLPCEFILSRPLCIPHIVAGASTVLHQRSASQYSRQGYRCRGRLMMPALACFASTAMRCYAGPALGQREKRAASCHGCARRLHPRQHAEGRMQRL